MGRTTEVPRLTGPAASGRSGRRGGAAVGRPGFWSCMSSPGAIGFLMPGRYPRTGRGRGSWGAGTGRGATGGRTFPTPGPRGVTVAVAPDWFADQLQRGGSGPTAPCRGTAAGFPRSNRSRGTGPLGSRRWGGRPARRSGRARGSGCWPRRGGHRPRVGGAGRAEVGAGRFSTGSRSLWGGPPAGGCVLPVRAGCPDGGAGAARTLGTDAGRWGSGSGLDASAGSGGRPAGRGRRRSGGWCLRPGWSDRRGLG